jgi:hypothetical protein
VGGLEEEPGEVAAGLGQRPPGVAGLLALGGAEGAEAAATAETPGAERSPQGETGQGVKWGLKTPRVDGVGWQGFPIESQFWAAKVDFDPIALLHVPVGQRPVGTLGLYLSAFDHTAAALESAAGLRPIRVLLFDQKDLIWAMERRRGMMELVGERRIGELAKDRSASRCCAGSARNSDLEEVIDRQVRTARARPRARLF